MLQIPRNQPARNFSMALGKELNAAYPALKRQWNGPGYMSPVRLSVDGIKGVPDFMLKHKSFPVIFAEVKYATTTKQDIGLDLVQADTIDRWHRMGIVCRVLCLADARWYCFDPPFSHTDLSLRCGLATRDAAYLTAAFVVGPTDRLAPV